MENDPVKEAHEAVSKLADTASAQLGLLLTGQRDSWSPQPRAHSTETAYSNTLSNVTAVSASPLKRRSLTPLGSIRNEQNRSRTSLRRADLFSKKSLLKSGMAQLTLDVDTARPISSRSSSRTELPPLMIIQTTSHSRSPFSSRSDVCTAVGSASNIVDHSPNPPASSRLVAAKSFPTNLNWTSPTKQQETKSVRTARETTPTVSTARQMTLESRLHTALENSSTKTAKTSVSQMTALEQQTKSNKGTAVEKLGDGRLKVTMTMDVSAPGGRAGLSGQAPDGMKIKWVTVNGVSIFGGQ